MVFHGRDNYFVAFAHIFIGNEETDKIQSFCHTPRVKMIRRWIGIDNLLPFSRASSLQVGELFVTGNAPRCTLAFVNINRQASRLPSRGFLCRGCIVKIYQRFVRPCVTISGNLLLPYLYRTYHTIYRVYNLRICSVHHGNVSPR